MDTIAPEDTQTRAKSVIADLSEVDFTAQMAFEGAELLALKLIRILREQIPVEEPL